MGEEFFMGSKSKEKCSHPGHSHGSQRSDFWSHGNCDAEIQCYGSLEPRLRDAVEGGGFLSREEEPPLIG